MANYSIALGVQPPQIDLSGALQLSNQMQRQKLADQQALQAMELERERFGLQKQQFQSTLAAQQAAQREKQAQKNALAEYVKAQGAGDENALNKLAAYPDIQSKVLAVRNQMDENSRAKFDQSMTRNARRAQFVAGLQGEEKNQAWQSVLKEAVDSGDITPEMYQQYSSTPPNDLLLNNVIQQAVPIQQLYQQPTAKMQELEAAGIKQGTPEFSAQVAPAPLPKFEKVNNRLLRIGPDGVPVDVTPPMSQGAMSENSVKLEQSLRKEYADLSKNFRAIQEGADRVKVGADLNNGVGDLSLIFGYMKLLDPGSVVREGEFANAENAQGVPDRIRNVWNKIISGERLNPATRQEFVSAAQALANEQLQRQQRVTDQFQAIATDAGLEPSRIIMDFGANEAPPPPPAGDADGQTGQQIPQEAIDELKANPTPEAARYFDEVFGPGAAQRVFGR